LFKSIQDELFAVYSQSDAMKIYCISLLRVCDKGIRDFELKEAYETSFLSELYPGVSLSKNTVSTFLNDLGKTMSRIVTFMRNRTASVSLDHHYWLMERSSRTNPSELSLRFFQEGPNQGTRDISVLFAFDLEAMEPVCSKCFPGNMLDATSYEAFIKENQITKGIIVGDKGFRNPQPHEEFESHPDLHYLNPIKRNSKLITRHSMLDFTAILPVSKASLTARKSASVSTNGSIPTGAVPRPPKKKATGCTGQRRKRHTALKNSGRSRRRSAQSCWSVIWIFLRRLPINVTPSRHPSAFPYRRGSSCIFL
jgi:hypothetical protein